MVVIALGRLCYITWENVSAGGSLARTTYDRRDDRQRLSLSMKIRSHLVVEMSIYMENIGDIHKNLVDTQIRHR
jgi:hypothetical protein